MYGVHYKGPYNTTNVYNKSDLPKVIPYKVPPPSYEGADGGSQSYFLLNFFNESYFGHISKSARGVIAAMFFLNRCKKTANLT